MLQSALFPLVEEVARVHSVPLRSLVLVHLFTGRQHQIRVHMQAIGCPLVGDKLYGPDREIFLRNAAGELTDYDRELLVIERHALHAHRLGFRALESDADAEVVSPLPPDLCAAFPEFADHGRV